MLSFQFHKGTIRTHSPQCCGTGYRHFNSIKVQLELQEDSSSFYMRKNFNSIKVQLERHTSYMPADRNPFQFHKGTIRTLWQTQLRRSIAHFNSIKVQLELYNRYNIRYHTNWFQFHKGTIRTRQSLRFPLHPSPFQFHKGTIRTVNSLMLQLFSNISIP